MLEANSRIAKNLRAIVTLFAVVLAMQGRASGADINSLPAPDLEAVERCREVFPDVINNIEAEGGWFLEDFKGRRLLCLYGSLEASDVDAFVSELADIPIDIAVARSTGGPVNRWLVVAESLFDKVALGIIDEACFSSCANYFVILPDIVRAVKNSLLVWHGGPSENGEVSAEANTIELVIDYLLLYERTYNLYALANINIAILSDTRAIASDAKISVVLAAMKHLAPQEIHISGYALSPERLLACYGFKNVNEMWHAGGDKELLELGKNRDEHLVILEYPTSDFCEE